MGGSRIKVKKTLKIKIQTELLKGDCITYYRHMYFCHLRASNDNLNRELKRKILYLDFIIVIVLEIPLYLFRFITGEVPLLSFCASLGAQLLMQPYKNTNL